MSVFYDKEKVKNLVRKVISTENFYSDEPLRNHTSFKIGGPADIFVRPKSVEEILEVINISKENNVPYFVIGNGTNLLVADEGFRGIIIRIARGFDRIEVEDDCITCQSGAPLPALSVVAQQNGLSGLEFAIKIPGTVGGSTYMNAGAYGGEMKDTVIHTKFLDENNELKELNTNSDHLFSYRNSYFKQHKSIILETKMCLKYADPLEIKSVMDDFCEQRRAKQPKEPSAGSVFKRPKGNVYVARTIEAMGLKGFRIGGAVISALHAGFIVNNGEATCKDVINLINYIKERFYKELNVNLETEIEMLCQNT